MKDYYSILEVPKGATGTDIKKAYFRMVRQYPPDKMPEEFQRVREAYEVLIDENTRKEYDSIEAMPSVVKLYFNNGKKAIEEGDYEKAVRILKEVTKEYPDFTVLNSLLGDACLLNGNSGSAVSIYKKLVNQEPLNASFAGKLAHAYLERGWLKRAVKQYKIALSLDEDNISFWEGLISCYLEEDHLRMAKKTARVAIKVSMENGWDSLNIYIILIQLDITFGELDDLETHLEEIKDMAKKYTDNKDNVAWFLATIGKLLQEVGQSELAASIMETAHALLPEEENISNALTDISNESNLRNSLNQLYDDNSFPDYLAPMLDLELDKLYDVIEVDDVDLEIFLWEMDLIFEINTQRKYIRLLKEKYPELFSLKDKLFNRVLNISQTKKLHWEYVKQLKKYAKLYPTKFEVNDVDDVDDVDDLFIPQEPIRREGPKIGRNEPCPCGSGKKYKKCCGK